MPSKGSPHHGNVTAVAGRTHNASQQPRSAGAGLSTRRGGRRRQSANGVDVEEPAHQTRHSTRARNGNMKQEYTEVS
jgi:hypothetical protein